MELNFRLQRNDELRLERLCNKLVKKSNRYHIVEDMILVKKAKKRAILEENLYKEANTQKLPAKRSQLSRKYEESKLKTKVENFKYKVKSKVYSYESTYLYFWYRILDLVDYIVAKKKIFISAACTLVVITGAVIGYNYAFGYEIIFNGHSIGIVNDMSVYNNAMDSVKDNFATWYENDSIYFEESVTIRNTFINDRDTLLSEKQCEEAIYACDIPLFYNGGIITIDGVETIRLASVTEAQAAVDEFLNAQMYDTQENTELVRLVDTKIDQDIKVEEKIIAMGTEYSVDEAVDYLSSLGTVQAYTNIEGASLESLYTTTGDSVGIVTALAFRSDEFSVSKLTIKPALKITTVKEVKYTEDIAYDTVYEDDPYTYIGQESVITPGIPGQKTVNAVITYINGKEISVEIRSESVSVEPTAEVVARGTKLLPPAASTGVFVIPTSGKISRVEGDSSHTGGLAVDISNSYGTQIYASDSGVVRSAEWAGDYGYMIIIEHADGYSTYYAHLSSMDVVIGQQVAQGQPIAHMGSTGRSTGTHLHFEIRYNGVRQPITDYFRYFEKGQQVTALQ